MANVYKYFTPFVKLFWTKRFVCYRPSSIRTKLKREKCKHHVRKRPCTLLLLMKLHARRLNYGVRKPQRQNFNTAYRPMQIPA